MMTREEVDQIIESDMIIIRIVKDGSVMMRLIIIRMTDSLEIQIIADIIKRSTTRRVDTESDMNQDQNQD